MATAKNKNKPMDKERFRTVVITAVTDAENYKEQEVSPFRLKAWMYWNGRSDLPAQTNRSKVVMTEVSDTIEQTVPQLMDMFTSGDDAVAFSSESVEDDNQKFAWQATKLVSHIFWNKNDGWCLMEDFVRDALIAKTGVFKVSMREKSTVSEAEFTGLSQDEFAILVSANDVEVLSQEIMPGEVPTQPEPAQMAPPPPAPNANGMAGPPPGMNGAGPPPGAMMGGPPQQMGPPPPPPMPEPVIDCRIRCVKQKPEYYVDVIAPEDFIINRAATATTKTDFRLIGERRLMMVSDVVEMGIPLDIAVKHSGYEGALYDEQEREQRQYRNIYRHDQSTEDDAVKTIVVYEIYLYADKDGDGIAELHKVLAIGDRAAYIHDSEIVDDHPYAVGTPVKVPHAVIGKSQADLTTDLQDINTQIMRQVLDNLTHVNNPRTEAVTSQVDMNDLKDNRFAGIVKVRQPGMVRYLETPFVASQSMPILEYMDERKEQRTGISKESSALNAEALQSSTETGVRAVIGAAQSQIKMIARTLCETGVKEMYRKLLRLVIQHQDEEMQIRVAGMPMKVDPRLWKDDDMDVKVHIGMGAGTRDEKLAALMNISQQQQAILQQMPENPFVLPSHFGYTLHKMTMLAGCGPSEFYWKAMDKMDEEAQALLQKQQQQESQTPEIEAMMKIEMAKVEAKKAADQAKLQNDMQRDQAKMQMEAQMGQQKLQQQMQADMAKMQAQMQLEMMKARQMMELEMMKVQITAQGNMEEAEIDAMIEQRKMEQNMELRTAEMAIEAQLEKYRIDNDTQIGPANIPRPN